MRWLPTCQEKTLDQGPLPLHYCFHNTGSAAARQAAFGARSWCQAAYRRAGVSSLFVVGTQRILLTPPRLRTTASQASQRQSGGKPRLCARQPPSAAASKLAQGNRAPVGGPLKWLLKNVLWRRAGEPSRWLLQRTILALHSPVCLPLIESPRRGFVSVFRYCPRALAPPALMKNGWHPFF